MTQQKKDVLLLNALPSVVIGEIAHLDAGGYPHVTWEGQTTAIRAETQQRIAAHDSGKRCTLAFIHGEQDRPVIMGLLYSPETTGESPLIIRSDERLILQSGAARIELNANGRINIRGLHIDSQAYGPNRIKGAAVKIN